MKKIGTALASLLISIVVVCIIAAIVSLPVLWLWNWLMPDIFGLCEINILQAFGLMLLSRFLLTLKITSSGSED